MTNQDYDWWLLWAMTVVITLILTAANLEQTSKIRDLQRRIGQIEQVSQPQGTAIQPPK